MDGGGGEVELKRVLLIAFATGVAVGVLVQALCAPAVPVAPVAHGDCGCKGKKRPPAVVLRLVHTFEEAPPAKAPKSEGG